MDIDEIRKWHRIFKPDNELFEIRVLGNKTYSAYFYDIEEAIKALPQYDNFQIYFTVNKVKDACSGRTQFGVFERVDGSATSKNDIESRQWLPIDIDVERPSKISASDEEKEYAHKKAVEVFKFLRSVGFPDPIVCDSSSGYHIYYPIDISNTAENETLIKSFYSVLSSFFTDERVKIDVVVGDANRIMRLYGTWGRKGRNSKDRPHRLSKILSSPEITHRISREELYSFVEEYKVKDEGTTNYRKQYNGNGEEFNLRKFIAEHGIEVVKELPYGNGGTKFILKECPFDSGHKAPDSALFLSANGAIGFKCLHNSCANHDWHELRLKFDPHAYDRKEYEPRQQYRQYIPQQTQKKKYEIKDELPELGKKWFCMSDIKKVDLSDIENMKTGFNELDRLIVGLYVGEVSIISGNNSSGKSSWINTIILNIIQQGKKVALWSGELPATILKIWILNVAAGKNYLKLSNKNDGKYYTPNNISERICSWMDGKFFLYNNEYTNKWEQIFHDMEELCSIGVKLFILDNLFSLDIDIFDGDKNNKQKELILNICKFAKSKKVHLILVAHPRKVTTLLRKTDISGSSDLTNAVDNVFIVHRVNDDFMKAGADFWGKKKVDDLAGFGNCVEIAKNRMYGVVDSICGMYYEVESRRFKNSNEEYIHYGWEEQPNQQSIPYEHPKEENNINEMPFTPDDDGESPF